MSQLAKELGSARQTLYYWIEKAWVKPKAIMVNIRCSPKKKSKESKNGEITKGDRDGPEIKTD